MKSAVFSRPVTVAIGAAMLLAASVVQAFQATPPVTLQSLAGHYQGHAKWSEGEAKVAADLRFAGGKVTGSLDSGEGPIAIVGATVSGDQVVWVLDMNGSPGRISGRLTNGRLEGEWAINAMFGSLVLTRTGEAQAPAVQPAAARPQPYATHPRLEVSVADFHAEGLILDIGGGGEGVIGQLKGSQVVAVDLSKRELDEAPGAPLLKIVMDARDLKFTDASFSTATVFFTFMYITPADHEKVFLEIHRVLKPGGRLLIWDPIFPASPDPAQPNILFPLRVKLPAKEINTGYGSRVRAGQGADHFAALAARTGFDLVARRNESGWFHLELRKGR